MIYLIYNIMAYEYLLLVILGLGAVVLGFYGAFLYKKSSIISNLLSFLMPIGIIITILGILLTVLPNFFKEPIW